MVDPAGWPLRGAVTSRKTSQPPVTGTVAVPRRVPAGESARISIVPPLPAEETRAVKREALSRLYGVKEIRSPSRISPTGLPTCADALSTICTPAESP